MQDMKEDVEVLSGKDEPSGDGRQLVLARHVLPSELNLIPLHNRPLFPKMTVPMIVDDAALVKMIREKQASSSKFLGLVLRRPERAADEEGGDSGRVDADDLYRVGVIVEVNQVAFLAEDGPAQLLVSALERFKITSFVRREPYLTATVEYLHETEMAGNEELRAYSIAVVKAIKDLVQLNPLHKEELSLFMSRSNLHEPGRLADFAAALTTAGAAELQDVLETVSIRARLSKVLLLLKKEIDISKMQAKISKQIEEKLSKQQREFFLREQLKAIKKELGIAKEGKEAEVERFQDRAANLALPPEARERIDEELEKFKLLEPASPEFHVTRTYLDWLTILPWGRFTKDSYDIHKAARILNRDHYGLDDIKERILEFLSVGIVKGNISGSILCFVGPPGVGKTSLGQSIARSIHRNFFRFSVGGIHDEAEIKGHRRTYIGAMPGKFIQVMKTCKSANPVMMLDEIDKIGTSYRGDPASALLEVLDPEQNRDFLDHYLDVRFDLSNVLFICTANTLDTIPRPLLDRMEVIKLAGYTLEEKLQISRRYLIPKQLREHGLKKRQVVFRAPALREIIDGYAREPGVRSLEKHIKKMIRKSVKKLVEQPEDKREVTVKLERPQVQELLGKRLFTDEKLYSHPIPGVVLGLAYTSLGGDTLYIEATAVKTGKPGLKQTGQLGDVMVESSEIAYTYVRGRLDAQPDARTFFAEHYVHLHVPAGATPKDGPSAGITMATALYSLALGVPVKKGIAMTGELTLTGRVMPIGGVKEKTLAARRAKIRHLIFPAENQKDFEELPQHVRKGITPHYAQTFDEVISLCFRP